MKHFKQYLETYLRLYKYLNVCFFFFFFVHLSCNQSCRPTLVLTWIPNTTLKKNPQSIESSPIKSHSSTPKVSPRRNPKQEFAKSDESVTLTPSPSPSTQDSYPDRRLKKLSNDTTSICSEISVESKEDSASIDESNVGEDMSRESGSRLSSSCKSQTDSGIGTEEVHLVSHELQNNEKSVQSGVKPSRVGVHVNNLNSWERGPRSDHKNMQVCKDPNQSTDELTSEEQLVAMLNRNKLHAKMKDKISSSEFTVSAYLFIDACVCHPAAARQWQLNVCLLFIVVKVKVVPTS